MCASARWFTSTTRATDRARRHRAELQNYLHTIEIFDVDWLAGMSVGIFPLQPAEADAVVTELEELSAKAARRLPACSASCRWSQTRCW